MEEETSQWPLVNEIGEASAVPRERMDELWALGWRHFGPKFFRYSLMWQDERWKRVLNLRVLLKDWKPSRSQRRTLRQNEDLAVKILPASPSEQEVTLFHRHKKRFQSNVPDHLSDFLGEEPNGCPCPCLQIAVLSEGRLVATSYLDLGQRACSSIYGVFDPDESHRRLGIFTMLQEMLYAQTIGLDYYYLGYACIENSPYDYKKELRPLELWDWRRWHPITPDDYSTLAPPIGARFLG